MPRTRYHVTPESGRMTITLNKRQLKEFKKMSIEFEMSAEDILQIAVDSFIERYQKISAEEMDRKGIGALLK
ncbi:MAG: hypothetical protein R2941_12155 [Desulfobacterales bacterium]